MEMRKAFVEELDRIMEKDSRVCVIDADLGRAGGTLPLHEKYPERAFDVGIAEANMTSVAAGLASYGFVPFIQSFAPFVSRRACDQVMISVAYAKRAVKLVGTDPGITATLNGGTHMPFEDIAIMRSMPTMVIFEPVDEVQIQKALPQIIEHDGPVYIRLARKEQPKIFSDDYKFELFKADTVRKGADVTILATGIMLKISLDAAELLAAEGIDAEVVNVHTIKPLDEETILASAKKTGAVVTAENHNVIGGLYSAVAELFAAKCPMHLERVGVEDEFGQVGKLAELAAYYHMTAADVVEKAKRAIAAK